MENFTVEEHKKKVFSLARLFLRYACENLNFFLSTFALVFVNVVAQIDGIMTLLFVSCHRVFVLLVGERHKKVKTNKKGKKNCAMLFFVS
jgi:hypothetical protein